jgi:hypothetical protein
MDVFNDILNGKTSKLLSEIPEFFENEPKNTNLFGNNFLDVIINDIFKAVEIDLPFNLPRCAISKNGILACSHDVDYVKKRSTFLLSSYKKWWNNGIRMPLSIIFYGILNLLPFVNYANNFSSYEKIESKNGVKSTYFFLPRTLQQVNGKILKKIQKKSEIAIHGDIGSATSDEALKTQLIAFSEILSDIKINGIRQHYLEYEYYTTWELHNQNGLVYDSTIGFSDETGYRAGTCCPYSTNIPSNIVNDNSEKIPIIEIPLIIMDTYLQNLIIPDAKKKWIKDFSRHVNIINSYRGVLSVNWHLSSLKVPLGNLYTNLIELCKEKEFEMLTHNEVSNRVIKQLQLLNQDKKHISIKEDKLEFSPEFIQLFNPKYM